MIHIDANIALYGFMGTGKTTTGRLLAQILSRTFVDLDQYIELRNGMQISEMFAKHGEELFRMKEEEAVLAMPIENPHILALGGGTLLREKCRTHIREHYKIYTLMVPFSVLKDRLKGEERPLAVVADSLYTSRLEHYQSLGTPISVTTQSPAVCAELILEHLHAA